MRTRVRTSFVVLLAAVAVRVGAQEGAAGVGDWPQWRGPERTGISRETGLLRQWPAAGPPVVWNASGIGAGYGSVAVSGDRVFVQGLRGGDSAVFALNRADGKLVWSRPLGAGGNNDRGPGPRGTPTVEGDRLYVLTENGNLASIRAQDGTIIWQRNILRDFGARNIPWEISESPLIEGDNLIVTPGGRGAGMVALDKTTGKTVWTAKELNDEAGYASPVAATVHGVRVIATLTGQAGVGVRASDGRLMWRYPRVANGTANITTPVFVDNRVFYTSNYGTGGALLALTAQNGLLSAQEVYFTREMQNHHGGVIALGGHLYGFHNSILTCLDLATGRTVWRDRSVGKGAISYADGHFYIVSENNLVGLVEASSAGYRERGRFEIADHGWPTWAHPVIAGGRLFIRNQGTLTAYDVRQR
jgi:outer membrane protein assembly factor BamB